MTKKDEQALAVAMRLAGRTYDEIAAELGVSKGSLSVWLHDLPHPDPLRDRPPADPLAEPVAFDAATRSIPTTTAGRRALARELREGGWLLREIAALLGVSVRPVHRYVADLPVPARARHGGDPDHMAVMRRARWDKVLAERELERQVVKATAAAEVGVLTRRELHLAAVTAYWAEGSKSKPWRRSERVTFINSDEGMIRLWLAYLDDLGVEPDRRRFAVSIHESADVPAATRSWAEVAGVPAEFFLAAMLKRHNANTMRKNVGADYRGCLVIRVLQGRQLYQHIEGTWEALAAGLPAGPEGR